MRLPQWIKRLFQPAPAQRPVCPKCGSEEMTLVLTEWVIGHELENNGRTKFMRSCKSCGHRWE